MSNLEIHESTYRQLHAVTIVLDDLEAIGLVTAKNADTARAAVARAKHAEHLAGTYDSHVRDIATQAGNALASTDELDLGAVIDAVTTPPFDQVKRTLKEVWTANTNAARKAAFGNIHQVPQTLTKRFDGIAKEASELRAKLGIISTADQAIEFELHKEWLKVAELRDQHNALSTLRSNLRDFGLIQSGDGYNFGWHWNFRKEPQVGAMTRARELQDGGRAAFFVGIACEPYCPGSREEAEATLKAAESVQETV